MEMENLLLEELPEKISAPIRAARSFFAHENSATYQKSLSEEMTLANLSRRKLELRLSLAHFNLPSQISNTSQESGRKIVTKKDFWVYHSQE